MMKVLELVEWNRLVGNEVVKVVGKKVLYEGIVWKYEFENGMVKLYEE